MVGVDFEPAVGVYCRHQCLSVCRGAPLSGLISKKFMLFGSTTCVIGSHGGGLEVGRGTLINLLVSPVFADLLLQHSFLFGNFQIIGAAVVDSHVFASGSVFMERQYAVPGASGKLSAAPGLITRAVLWHNERIPESGGKPKDSEQGNDMIRTTGENGENTTNDDGIAVDICDTHETVTAASVSAAPMVEYTIPVASRIRALPPYLFARLNRLKYAKRHAGEDVIDLGMGSPSDAPEECVIEKLVEAARDPSNHGYSHAIGLPGLRREVASKYLRHYGIRIDPESQAVVSLGSKDAFSHLMLALLDEGDVVMVPAPSYPAHMYAVQLAGGVPVPLVVYDPEKYLADIERTCTESPRKPKLLVMNFPHNPSATVVDASFYVKIAALAKRYGFFVVSDLAYADVMFDDYRTPSFLATPGGLDVGIELTTMSKGYNMAGWRVGFCVGNTEMVRALSTIKTYYDYGSFTPIQIAAILALRQTDAAVEAQAKLYQRRRDVLCDGLDRIGWPVTRPKASMFVWAKIPEPWASRMNTMDFAMKLLEEGNVVASPGSGFGPAGEGFLRLALVENDERLRQAVRQIGRCLG